MNNKNETKTVGSDGSLANIGRESELEQGLGFKSALTQSFVIRTLGDGILHRQAQKIPNSVTTSQLQDLQYAMLKLMHEAKGVGIAAPQIGVAFRALIIESHANDRYPDAPEMPPLFMVNPQLLAKSESQILDWEGCLSVPGRRAQVLRADAVILVYFDADWQRHYLSLNGFVARIFLHELDHLNGVLFPDHLRNADDLLDEAQYLAAVTRPQ